jgi:hypothetical protein
MLRAFPMILITVLLYNAMAFGGAASGHDSVSLLAQTFTLHLFSGDAWKITLGDLFVALALTFLFIETVRATRNTTRELVNHALSMLTFSAALVEFITLKGFGTTTFFFIMAMCLFDVVAGYTISIIATRRNVEVMHGGHGYDD